MTKETMTIHEALATLKILDKRIKEAIGYGTFVVSNKHSNAKINGIPVADFSKNMVSAYNSLRDMMRRRDAIKRAIVLSNASTVVSIGDKTYYVAEAIELKNGTIEAKRDLVNAMSRQFALAKKKANDANGAEMDERVERHLQSIFGSSDKRDPDAVSNARSQFIAQQTVELVDPLRIENEILTLSAELDEFTSKIDAALSVSNALTTIHIEY